MVFYREPKPEPTKIFSTALSCFQNFRNTGMDSRLLVIGRPLIDLTKLKNKEIGKRVGTPGRMMATVMPPVVIRHYNGYFFLSAARSTLKYRC